MASLDLTGRSSGAWLVCGLLLLASAVNYMDRQTLSVASVQIKSEFHLTDEQYGSFEQVFGFAFAAGSLAFGLVVDRASVRIVYPSVLLAWSAMGVITGYARDYDDLYYCRMLLGFFEGGHWPCALRTTLLLLAPSDRMFGNSLLQSGVSIGAIATPALLNLFSDPSEPGSWRPVFIGVGVAGIGWVVLWILAMPSIPDHPIEERSEALEAADAAQVAWWHVLVSRKFWLAAFVVIAINITWQLFRAWTQLFLVKGRDYSETDARWFSIAYYVAADIGCVIGGVASRMLHDRGATVFRSRLAVFGVASFLCLVCFALPWLPHGWLLLGVMLLVGASTLALFPCYYSWAQEVAPRQQGLVSGLLGTLAWVATSPIHPNLGAYVDQTGRYDLALAWSGLPPVLAFVVVLMFWREDEPAPTKDEV